MFGLLGIAFLLLGVADLIASYLGSDIWELIPVAFPREFTDYSGYITIGIGAFCLLLGRKKKLPQRF